MRKTFALILVSGALFMASCGPSAADKAAAEQARIDSIAQAEVAAAKQAMLDSLAKVEEAAAAQAKVDSLNAELAKANEQNKTAQKAAVKATQKPKEVVKEPVQATPTRSGATKRPE